MSGATGAAGPDDFAALLRKLKDRSGLSYAALAKRLHTSTSTLHRYCNGTAVPNAYAPVERLARLCKATPDELVELHRQWILADATRGQRPEPAAARPATTPTAPATTPAPEAEPTADSPSASPIVPTGPTAPATAPEQNAPDDGPLVSDKPRQPARRPRRRTVWIAAVTVTAVLGAVALAVLPDSDEDSGNRRAGNTATETEAQGPSTRPSATSDDKDGKDGKENKGGKDGKPSASATPPTTESGKGDGGSAKSGGGQSAGDSTGVPLSVAVRPYVYATPCSQHFLVDSEPEQVGPPANEPDAPRWAGAYGAVSSGEQRLALTLQGTGKETVVLEALHVRVVGKGAPLAWNDYSMGVGCGGNVPTKEFAVDLDQGSPAARGRGGQRDFPYKVSESDPEVFYVTARTVAHDVRWELSLDWSSGDRRGTLRINDGGKPFRTSSGKGRPGYDYPLGGGEWIERVDG